MERYYELGDVVICKVGTQDGTYVQGDIFTIKSRTFLNGDVVYEVENSEGESSYSLNRFELLESDEKDTGVAQDAVNHPAHYNHGGIEVIDFIESNFDSEMVIGYYLGNLTKYISRSPYKNDMVEDLEKAQWYLNRLLKYLK